MRRLLLALVLALGVAWPAAAQPLYGLYADPQASESITTVAAFNADDAGYARAYERSEANGADLAYYTLHVTDIMPTTVTRNWTRYDRFVRSTSKPIVFNLAPVDGAQTYFPSDLSPPVALTDAAFTTPLIQLVQDMAARTPAGRVIYIGFGNEIDAWLAGNPGTRVMEYAMFLNTMKAAAQSAFGASTGVYASFTYHSVADGSYLAGNFAAVALVGTDPVFTYYPVDAATFVVYDFTAGTGGMGDDFTAMLIATGTVRAFALQEMGCPSGALVTAGAPAGGGEATQEAFIATYVNNIAAPYAAYLRFVTFLWQNDLSAAVVTDLGLTPGSNVFDFYSSLGLRTATALPKAGYDDVVTVMGGVLNPTSRRQVLQRRRLHVSVMAEDIRRIAA